MSYSVGIDLGGSNLKAVAVQANGTHLDSLTLPFEPRAELDWAVRIRSLIQQWQSKFAGPAASIGLSAPGLAAKDARTIAYLPGRLPGLVGLDWTTFLASNSPIPVMNDAQAALLGEVWLGAARGLQNVLLLTLGTGVGGAAMVDGHILHGHTGKAGHLGHICLDIDGPPDICNTPGSLEMMIGNCTVAERTAGRFKTTHELLAAHRAGNPQATAAWQRSIKALACAIGSFTNILDPEAVIIGGGIAQAGNLLFQPLQNMVQTVEWTVCHHHVKILPAKLGELAGAYGAARRGLDLLKT